MKRHLIIIVLTLSFMACSGGSKSGNAKIDKPHTKQFNISILLDLSDRISPQINPEAQVNDIENIKAITEFFKSNMSSLGAYNAKGKIRVFFSPSPSNANINSTVSKLIFDCSRMDNKKRKDVYDNITELYSKSLINIYNETIATSAWEGSDIWRFFKDDVKDYCIEKDTNYRNILIVLTDGYLYHKQSVFNKNNRYTYLLGNSNLREYRNQNWEQSIDQNDFGILTERNDLDKLEVLVLEIRSENPSNKIDEDILRYLWKRWLKEMNVSHYEVYPSDLPVNTKTRIESFLNQQ